MLTASAISQLGEPAVRSWSTANRRSCWMTLTESVISLIPILEAKATLLRLPLPISVGDKALAIDGCWPDITMIVSETSPCLTMTGESRRLKSIALLNGSG